MRRMFLFAAIAFLSVGFIACDDDEDNKVEIWTSLTTVNVPDPAEAPQWFPIGSQQPFYLTLDNGKTLYPALINSFLVGYRINNDYRALASYLYLSGKPTNYDSNIQLIDIQNVLTKPIYVLAADTANNSVLRGKAPIDIEKAWVGDGFINIIFDYKASAGSTHYINLIEDQITGPMPNPNGNTWSLNFVHDAAGDTGGREFRGIVSFMIPDSLSAAVTQIKISAINDDGTADVTDVAYSHTQTQTTAIDIKGLSDEIYK